MYLNIYIPLYETAQIHAQSYRQRSLLSEFDLTGRIDAFTFSTSEQHLRHAHATLTDKKLDGAKKMLGNKSSGGRKYS